MQNEREILNKIIENVQKVIIGKKEVVELALMAVISEGHVLVEDVPGVGKTSLVSAFAKSIDCSYKRIQFTPDVMPSDITGFSVYNPKTGEFMYKKGAVLHSFVQADEINRTSSKTQASMLEVMEERQVTVDGNTYKAPSPFVVFATQNPNDHAGTHSLPESQLDRFFMSISLGYPSLKDEVAIIMDRKDKNPVESLRPVATVEQLMTVIKAVSNVYLDTKVAAYIVSVANATRKHHSVSLGASPRASLHLARIAKAWALYSGRDFVLPDDVQKMAVHVLSHRIMLRRDAKIKKISANKIIEEIIAKVQVIQKDKNDS